MLFSNLIVNQSARFGPFFLCSMYKVIVNERGFSSKIKKSLLLISKNSFVQLNCKQDLKNCQNLQSFIQLKSKPSSLLVHACCTTKMKPITKTRDGGSQIICLPTGLIRFSTLFRMRVEQWIILLDTHRASRRICTSNYHHFSFPVFAIN